MKFSFSFLSVLGHSMTCYNNSRLCFIMIFKDRQHRTRGGVGFSFITNKARGVEYHVIYQI